MEAELSESIARKLESEKDASEASTSDLQSPFSKKLNEIFKSMQIINQCLKELSVERRSQVSQMQWATIEEFKSSPKMNIKQNKFWQKSLFVRTYFVDKDLDELFKQVMKYSSTLFTHLNNLNGKLQCRNDAELEILSTTRLTKPEIPLESPRGSVASVAVDLPSKIRKTKETACGDDEDLDNLVDVQSIQQSFTDLIRAKVEFDSQFLKFNALLSKTSYSEDFQYLYEICAKSNMILEQTSLSIDKCESVAGDSGRIRRKRQRHQSINDAEGQSHIDEQNDQRPRRSKRLANIANEVQIIRSFKHIK